MPRHPEAINLLENRSYPHHPAILEAAQGPYVFHRTELVELNGLRVPRLFD